MSTAAQAAPLDSLLDAFEECANVLAKPYVAFVVLRYRVARFINRPMHTTLDELCHPQWLAEFIVATPLVLLAIMIEMGIVGAILAKVMPLLLWSIWLSLIGGAHLICLFWGTRKERLICSVFHPWIYGCLLLALGVLSSEPRLAVAFLVVMFVGSVIIPFTLRDRDRVNGKE